MSVDLFGLILGFLRVGCLVRFVYCALCLGFEFLAFTVLGVCVVGFSWLVVLGCMAVCCSVFCVCLRWVWLGCYAFGLWGAVGRVGFG